MNSTMFTRTMKLLVGTEDENSSRRYSSPSSCTKRKVSNKFGQLSKHSSGQSLRSRRIDANRSILLKGAICFAVIAGASGAGFGKRYRPGGAGCPYGMNIRAAQRPVPRGIHTQPDVEDPTYRRGGQQRRTVDDILGCKRTYSPRTFSPGHGTMMVDEYNEFPSDTILSLEEIEEMKIEELEKYLEMHENDYPEIYRTIAMRLNTPQCECHSLVNYTSERIPTTDTTRTKGMDQKPQLPKSGNVFKAKRQGIEAVLKELIKERLKTKSGRKPKGCTDV